MAFRVLSIDGGGMRGIYSATYLAELERGFAARMNAQPGLDVAKGFQLLVGTSTGALIACGLAMGVSANAMSHLYRTHGRAIFPSKLPDGVNLALLRQLACRPADLAEGDLALTRALEGIFGQTTMGQVWRERQIALAIPAVNM